jgi:hypothetical protein
MPKVNLRACVSVRTAMACLVGYTSKDESGQLQFL